MKIETNVNCSLVFSDWTTQVKNIPEEGKNRREEMVKDRLAELRLRRKGTWSQQVAPMDQVEKDTTQLLRTVSDIQRHISQLEKMVDEVERLHSDIITSPFSNDRNKELLNDINYQFKKLSQTVALQMREVDPSQNMYSSSSVAVKRMQDNHYSTLKNRCHSAINQYRNAETNFEDLRKARLKRQMSIVGLRPTNEELETLLRKENVATFTQSILADESLEAELERCRQTEKDMLHIEKNVNDIHDLYTDLKHLIHDQGSVIDSIEVKVTRSESYVDSGMRHLKKAKKSKKKYRKWKTFIGGTLLTILAGIAVVIIIIL